MTAMETLQHYLCSTAHGSAAQTKLFDVEQFINKKHCMCQMKLDDYVGQYA